jgi:hypothetical protein
MAAIVVFVGAVLIACEIADRRRHAKENAILLAVNRELATRQRQSSENGNSN